MFMKEILLMEGLMDMEFLIGIQDKYMKDNGKKA